LYKSPPIQSDDETFLPSRGPYQAPYNRLTDRPLERPVSCCSEAITEASENFGVKLSRQDRVETYSESDI